MILSFCVVRPIVIASRMAFLPHFTPLRSIFHIASRVFFPQMQIWSSLPPCWSNPLMAFYCLQETMQSSEHGPPFLVPSCLAMSFLQPPPYALFKALAILKNFSLPTHHVHVSACLPPLFCFALGSPSPFPAFLSTWFILSFLLALQVSTQRGSDLLTLLP